MSILSRLRFAVATVASIATSCSLPTTHLVATKWGGTDGGVTDGLAVGDRATRDGCVASQVDLTKPPGEVVLLLDRSSVMNTLDDPACGSCGTYWTALLHAVELLTSATSNNFRWALKLFPSPAAADACLVTSDPESPLSDNARATIASALASTSPGGGAPATTGVRDVVSYLGAAQGWPKLIVIALGASPTCAANDPTLDDLSAAVKAVDQAPYFTFILGFGSNRAPFEKLADVGATMSSYGPDQVASLLGDLEALARSLRSCSFVLPENASTSQTVNVLLDGAPLVRGGADGFSLSQDGSQVTLRGASCFYLDGHANLTLEVGCGG